MVKVFGPVISMGASGTLGDTITYRNSRGTNVASIKSNPSNPKTDPQMHIRAIFSAVGKISKRADLTGAVVTYLKAHRTAGDTWGSFYQKQEIGAGAAYFEASKTAYLLVGNAAKKTIFDDAAAQASIEAVDLDGTANTQVTAGLALWNAYEASFRLGDSSAPVTAASASEGQIFAFTDALTGVLPT